MSAIPMPHNPTYPQGHVEQRRSDEPDWMRIGVGATLLTGSVLLLTRQRKLGLLVTAAGSALAALEHKEIVKEWWEALPGYLDKAQEILDQTQHTIEDLSAKRDKIMGLFGR